MRHTKFYGHSTDYSVREIEQMIGDTMTAQEQFEQSLKTLRDGVSRVMNDASIVFTAADRALTEARKEREAAAVKAEATFRPGNIVRFKGGGLFKRYMVVDRRATASNVADFTQTKQDLVVVIRMTTGILYATPAKNLELVAAGLDD